jgi:hypothetical protein
MQRRSAAMPITLAAEAACCFPAGLKGPRPGAQGRFLRRGIVPTGRGRHKEKPRGREDKATGQSTTRTTISTGMLARTLSRGIGSVANKC